MMQSQHRVAETVQKDGLQYIPVVEFLSAEQQSLLLSFLRIKQRHSWSTV
jgi:hypothetical protein